MSHDPSNMLSRRLIRPPAQCEATNASLSPQAAGPVTPAAAAASPAAQPAPRTPAGGTPPPQQAVSVQAWYSLKELTFYINEHKRTFANSNMAKNLTIHDAGYFTEARMKIIESSVQTLVWRVYGRSMLNATLSNLWIDLNQKKESVVIGTMTPTTTLTFAGNISKLKGTHNCFHVATVFGIPLYLHCGDHNKFTGSPLVAAWLAKVAWKKLSAQGQSVWFLYLSVIKFRANEIQGDIWTQDTSNSEMRKFKHS